MIHYRSFIEVLLHSHFSIFRRCFRKNQYLYPVMNLTGVYLLFLKKYIFYVFSDSVVFTILCEENVPLGRELLNCLKMFFFVLVSSLIYHLVRKQVMAMKALLVWEREMGNRGNITASLPAPVPGRKRPANQS